MVFYIFPYHFFRHLVPNRSSKISIFPKFSTPKLFLYLRMLLKYYTATDILFNIPTALEILYLGGNERKI
jgi:hypothetical protein